MKNKKVKIKNILVVLFLITGLIVSALPATAASQKTVVTDVDKDGKISVGDTFCLGEECFYVISNKDGDVRALTKYNLYSGYITTDESDNAELMALYNSTDDDAWYKQMAYVYEHGYIECNRPYYDLQTILCQTPIDYSVDFHNLASGDKLYSLIPADEYSQMQNTYDSCYYSNTEIIDGVSYRRVHYCFNLVPKSTPVKQSPEAISAHGNERGVPDYPEIADYYFNSSVRPIKNNSGKGIYWWKESSYYNAKNNLVTTKYTENENSNIAGQYKNEIYDPVFKYKDYLTGNNYNVKDINLLSYDDLADILTSVNDKNLTFKHDGYQCPGNYTENDDGTWTCDVTPWVWRYVDSNSLYNTQYGYSSMLDYIPQNYKWVYSTTYWLRTSFLSNESPTEYNEDEVSLQTVNSYQFFVDTLGDLCFVNGSSGCGSADIGAGIRPVITMADSDLMLNELFDINGTVKWIDDNNSSNIRPQKSVIKLFRNGILIDTVEVTRDEDANLWRFSFTDLEKYDENGKEYVYTISQNDVPMYASDITNFDVVNQYAPSSSGTNKPSNNKSVTNPLTFDGIPLWASVFGGLIATVGIVLKLNRRRG